MNIIKIITVIALACITQLLSAQSNTEGVSIAPNVTPPHSSAMLDISSSNKGVLVPRVALTGLNDVTTIPNPASSLLVYNNSSITIPKGYYYWDGVWKLLGGGYWKKVNLVHSEPGNTFNYTRLKYEDDIPNRGELRFGFADPEVAGGAGTWLTHKGANASNGPTSVAYTQLLGNNDFAFQIRSFPNISTPSSPWTSITSQGTMYLGTTLPNKDIIFYAGNSYSGHITSNGNLFIAGALNPSDLTLKTNVNTLQGSLNKILQLRGVSYNWIDPNKSSNLQLGVIAQELETIFPELVSSFSQPNMDGTFEEPKKAVNYIALIAPLIESIKELKAIIDAQALRIQTLENQ